MEDSQLFWCRSNGMGGTSLWLDLHFDFCSPLPIPHLQLKRYQGKQKTEGKWGNFQYFIYLRNKMGEFTI